MSKQVDTMPEGTWVVQLVVPVVMACCLRAGWSVVGRLARAVLRAYAASASTSPRSRTRAQPVPWLSRAFSGLLRADGSVDMAQLCIASGLLVLASIHLAGLAQTYPLLAPRDPIDVFIAARLGVYEPTAELRRHLPEQQSGLARRLGSMDGRRAYLLFGSNVFSCEWCRPLTASDVPSPAGWGDHALHALLGAPLAALATHAVVLSVLSTDAGTLDLLGAAAQCTPLRTLAHAFAPLLHALASYSGAAHALDSPRTRTSRSAWRTPAFIALAALYMYRAAYSTYLSVWYASTRAAAPLDHWNTHFARLEHTTLAVLAVGMLVLPSQTPITSWEDEALAAANVPPESLAAAQATLLPLLQAQAAALNATDALREMARGSAHELPPEPTAEPTAELEKSNLGLGSEEPKLELETPKSEDGPPKDGLESKLEVSDPPQSALGPGESKPELGLEGSERPERPIEPETRARVRAEEVKGELDPDLPKPVPEPEPEPVPVPENPELQVSAFIPARRKVQPEPKDLEHQLVTDETATEAAAQQT